MADREARHVPLGLQVPERLVGLAQMGQEEPKRTPIIIDDVVSPRPRIDEFLRVANAVGERAGAAIHPETLARMVPCALGPSPRSAGGSGLRASLAHHREPGDAYARHPAPGA